MQATIEMWYIIFRPPKTVLKRRRNDGEKNRKKSLQKDGAMWYIVMVASREAAEMFLENWSTSEILTLVKEMSSAELSTLMESLILAQDERWRRA